MIGGLTMKSFYKKKFALTDQGAEDLVKASISSFFVYCINMVPAFIIMMLIDELVLENVKPHWLYFAVSFVTLLFMYWLLDREYENLYNSTYIESAHLRMQIADDLSNLPLSYFSKHNLSDLSQTIMSDVEGIEHAMSHAIPKSGGMALFFPFISVMLLVGNFKMGLAVILPTLFSFVLILLSKKSQTKANTKYYDTLRGNSEEFQETIELQQEINSFNLSKKVQDRLFKKMEESERIHLKVELSTFSVMALSSIFSYVSLAVVILVGVRLLLAGEVTILYVIGYLLAAIKIKDSFDSMKEGVLEIFYLAPKIQRIRAMKETNIQEGSESPLKSFDIELREVSFSYDSNTPILDHISFIAKQGEVTALVGASGSGKTSILKLVSRLYDYDEGCILIDGYDIKSVAPASLFSKIAIVFQEVTLFNTSILENIRIGNSQASDEEVKKAARLANCEDFIEKLPDGYHTLVGENGSSLSGGERQRLSIARAFLKNAPILILDEITASLDAENEKRIQESLNRLIQTKTVLIISHRLKSIENVDKIVVVDQGKVVDQGTHSELYRKSEIYKNLIKKTKMSEEFIY
jgi:ATP-binding cassette subfamily B protein IrtB